MEPVKLVVAGPAGAGKTTLIRSIADITVRSTGDDGVAFDLGRITIGRELVLYLHGAPAEPSGDRGWAPYSNGMLGSLVVVDGRRAEDAARALPHVRWFGRQPSPMVVVANRCPPGGFARVARTLGVGDDQVAPADVASRDEVRDIVLAVLALALAALEPSLIKSEIRARLG